MLVAKRQQQLICTLDYSKEALRQMRKHTTFHCPCCDARVILKVGAKMIAHFAHERASCAYVFSERESMQHLEGKAQLYTFFQRFSSNVTLEPYIQALQQRPDILVDRYAVEFQCSALAVDKIMLRTKGYNDEQYTPIWIPYARFTERGWRIVSFSQTEQQFFQWHRGLPFLMAYSPEKGAFMYYCSIVQLSATKFYTYIQPVALKQQQFPFVEPKPITKQQFIACCFLHEQYRQRALFQRLRFSNKGVQDDVLRRAYMRYGSILSLPAHIGIYVPHAYSWPIAPVDWQLYYVQWREQTRSTIQGAEASFLAFCGLHVLTNEQRTAVQLYEAIISEEHASNDALFSYMYDKIVALHV